jgi:hypothetical protein
MELNTIRTLMTGLVDYAGLFPPAGLSMREAVRNFAEYRQSDRCWMLGRFVVPIARLNEFEREVEEVLRAQPGETWRISGLIGDNLETDLERIFDFNATHNSDDNQFPTVLIDSIELKADDPNTIDSAMTSIPEDLEPFFEIPWKRDNRGLIAAMAGTGARAKIRTGGVTEALIPPTEDVARFIMNCALSDVAFKATAGLHHPVRADYRLTYEPDAPVGTMHGFLNVFVAAALARGLRLDLDTLTDVLNDDSRANFVFTNERIGWREHTIDVAKLALVRESFALSFGSCSFTEPVEDLLALNLLPAHGSES